MLLPSAKWRWPSPSGLPSWKLTGPLLALLTVLWATAPMVELNLPRLASSSGRFFHFAGQLVEMPDWGYFPQLVLKLIETVEMTVLGTFIATLVSLPLGVLAASNTSPHPWVCRLIRDLLSLMRAMPELVWALVFVSAVGLGPLAGTMALALVTVGFLGKIFAEAIEVVSPKAMEGVRAHGAGRMQVLQFAVLPQALPDLVGTVAYILDHNLRSATILGLVGAGGIGYDLIMSMRMFQYGRLIMIMAAIYLLVTALDRVSDHLRGQVIHGQLYEQ